MRPRFKQSSVDFGCARCGRPKASHGGRDGLGACPPLTNAELEQVRLFYEKAASQATVVGNQTPRMMEVVGPSGEVHYRRPEGDPMLEEARSRPGYTVRPVGNLDGTSKSPGHAGSGAMAPGG